MHLALYLFALLSLSQAGNLARFAAAPPEVLGFWRLLGACLVMLIFVATRRDYKALAKEWRGRNLFFSIFSGVFFYLHLWTYKFGAQNTSIANLMILFSTNPIFTALFSTVTMNEKLQKRVILSYFFSIIGVYLLLHHNFHFQSQSLGGDIAALCSAFLYSMYLLTGKQARRKMTTPAYTVFVYGIAAILFFLTVIWRQVSFVDYPVTASIGVIALIVFPTLLGHALFSYLLNYFNVNWMSTGKLLEPVLATVVAFYAFNESISRQAGLAYIFTALAVLILFAPWERLRRNLGRS
jgi:drug/metabolite transporter (DMT)-like permease